MDILDILNVSAEDKRVQLWIGHWNGGSLKITSNIPLRVKHVPITGYFFNTDEGLKIEFKSLDYGCKLVNGLNCNVYSLVSPMQLVVRYKEKHSQSLHKLHYLLKTLIRTWQREIFYIESPACNDSFPLLVFTVIMFKKYKVTDYLTQTLTLI